MTGFSASVARVNLESLESALESLESMLEALEPASSLIVSLETLPESSDSDISG